eukprot:2101766-Rhodomonas_salina.1
MQERNTSWTLGLGGCLSFCTGSVRRSLKWSAQVLEAYADNAAPGARDLQLKEKRNLKFVARLCAEVCVPGYLGTWVPGYLGTQGRTPGTYRGSSAYLEARGTFDTGSPGTTTT